MYWMCGVLASVPRPLQGTQGRGNEEEGEGGEEGEGDK